MPRLYRMMLPILAPVLLWQAKQLKRTIPRLPEAPGKRNGALGQGRPLNLLIIGDSAAAGVGATSQSQALSGRLSQALSEQFELNWCLMAKSGADIRSCIAFQDKQSAQSYDVILVSIGVNDVTGSSNALAWHSKLEQLIVLLHDKYTPNHIIFTKVPPMQEFAALKQPMRWYLGAKAAHFNEILANVVQSDACCRVLDIDGELSAEDMASDGFHPGPVIYQHWGYQASGTIKKLYKENAA